MFTRRAKAYSSSCSQTVSLSLATSSQFILGSAAAAEEHTSTYLAPSIGETPFEFMEKHHAFCN